MNIEGGGISMSAPIIGPSMGPTISGPAFGPVMGGPSFSFVNEGPASIASFESFSPLMPAAPDLGGTIGPIEALNSTFPIAESQSVANIFNEGPVGLSFLENTRPLGIEDFSYSPKAGIDVMVNPFLEPDEKWEMGGGNLETEVRSVINLTSHFNNPSSNVSRPTPLSLEWLMPGFLEPVPQEIKIGIAQPLIEEEEETQTQLEAVREKIRILSPKADIATTTTPVMRVKPATQPQQAVETEKITYKVVEEEQKAEESAIRERNRLELTIKRLVEDEKALAKRLTDARQAVDQAYDQATKMGKPSLSGQDVEKYLPDEYYEVRSAVLKEDDQKDLPDGSYLSQAVDIRQAGEVSSKEQMQSRVEKAIFGNRPVRRSKNEQGQPVTEEEVSKVYMLGRGKPNLRNIYVKMVRERETQAAQAKSGDNVKTLEVPAEMVDTSKEPAEEQKIEDNPQLAEILKLAA